jgi:dTDP-4-dehydrorhamnose 3,5-epimerase
MRVIDTTLSGVKIIQPALWGDERGWFAEFFNRDVFEAAGLPSGFVQDNQSRSAQGVLRGLHYQLGKPQGKLVRCLAGHIWDVAVDLRRDSPDFGRHFGVSLRPLTASGELQMLWIPEGFAHGFLVLSDSAEVLYKTTAGYYPQGERCIRWNDPTLAIEWPLGELPPVAKGPIVSAKDFAGSSFLEADLPPVSPVAAIAL